MDAMWKGLAVLYVEYAHTGMPIVATASVMFGLVNHRKKRALMRYPSPQNIEALQIESAEEIARNAIRNALTYPVSLPLMGIAVSSGAIVALCDHFAEQQLAKQEKKKE